MKTSNHHSKARERVLAPSIESASARRIRRAHERAQRTLERKRKARERVLAPSTKTFSSRRIRRARERAQRTLERKRKARERMEQNPTLVSFRF